MITDIEIPFLDLITPHVELEDELVDVFRHALRTAGFIGGPMVEKFEAAFAEFCDTRYAVAISSGTDALRFAIMTAGVQPGDVVLTVPNTFIATTEAISQARAIPEFVDVDEHTYNMSVVMLQRYLQKKCIRDKTGKLVSLRSGRPVTAVVPVHLYGKMADMDPILELADQYGLTVIEDACQAIGATYDSKRLSGTRRAGAIGTIAAFSFFPSKNLGGFGDGGMMTTGDDALAAKLRMLRVHGERERYKHQEIGWNSRLDALQAAVLRVKLPHLDAWAAGRIAHAERYDRLFAASGLVAKERVRIPTRAGNAGHVFNQYTIRVRERDALAEHLKARGIGYGIYYPIPLHLQECFKRLGHSPGDFPETERAAAEVLSLPVFPELASSQIEEVVQAIADFWA